MVEVYVASAFSKDGAGGNKAGVVLERPDLSAVEKMAIAKELGYSETAFVCAKENGKTFSLEYFTPTDEVPLCGHATIASFVVLWLLGKVSAGAYSIVTKAGRLSVRVEADGTVFMEQNPPAYGEILSAQELCGCVAEDAVEKSRPVQIVSTGLPDILLPVRSVEALAQLRPDFERMTEVSRLKNAVGFHAFALAEDGGITAVCRNFAPLYGIDEESATGTASCALACYLFRHHEKKEQYVFEQGYSLDLPSRITVNLVCSGDAIEQVWVGGQGILLEKKELFCG